LEIEFQGDQREEVSAHAGVALLVEVGRCSGVIATADRVLPAKKNPKGLTQGHLSDGTWVKLFAVVTNDWQMGGRELLEWQRGKAETVEYTHRVLKDELAAGVYPSGKFGANAAWLRLQVLTHNLLVLLKATALDAEYRHARPKRLRFAVFNHVGRVVHHARQTLMRVFQRVLARIIGPGLSRLRTVHWQAG